MGALRWTVISLPREGLGCRLTDGDVVRMPIRAVRPERDDDIRAEVVGDARDVLGEHPAVDHGEIAVQVVEALGMLDAEDCTGLSKLLLPDLAQRTPGGCARAADLSALPPGGRHDHGLPSLCRVLRQCPSGTEHLVVRVGEDTEQPWAVHLSTARFFGPGRGPAYALGGHTRGNDRDLVLRPRPNRAATAGGKLGRRSDRHAELRSWPRRSKLRQERTCAAV